MNSSFLIGWHYSWCKDLILSLCDWPYCHIDHEYLPKFLQPRLHSLAPTAANTSRIWNVQWWSMMYTVPYIILYHVRSWLAPPMSLRPLPWELTGGIVVSVNVCTFDPGSTGKTLMKISIEWKEPLHNHLFKNAICRPSHEKKWFGKKKQL